MAVGSSKRAASFSTSTVTFDVFLSFRGADTRLGFTDHLYSGLKQKGFIVFRDDEKLQRGENISEEIIEAIQESEYAVIVISKNFAFSRWCLTELTEILNCKSEKGLKVLPLFYHVEPHDVGKQNDGFARAFAKHKNDKVDEEHMKMWRDALKEVSKLAGEDVRGRHESEVVEKICKEISNGLSRKILNTDDDLVGIKCQMEKLTTLLHIRSDNVRFIGIHGMGGIGKTTLAEVIYCKICSRFEAHCFISNIREESQKSSSLLPLQKELIFQIFGEKEPKIHNTFQGRSMIAHRAKNKKLFIVLDDVDKEDQLNDLVGKHNWFGRGSRIIVTSRDRHLLNKYMDEIYEVEMLNYYDALQLFNQNAFKKHFCKGNYKEFYADILEYAGGLPLPLKVFGSFLLDCKIDAWKSAIDRLKADPGSNILDILKISFEGLDNIQQNLFLDIACFFKGKSVNEVNFKLKALGYYPENDIPKLESKTLIKISKDNILEMHDLLQQMGYQIVYGSQKEPGKRSRLWYHDDIIHVLKNNTGTNAIESIVLKLLLSKPVKLNFEAFSKMKRLRMLVICPNNDLGASYSEMDLYDLERYNQVVEWYGDPSKFILSNELRILEWWGFPLEYFPSSCDLDNLVSLKVHMSHIKQPWDGSRILDKSKDINVSHLQNLIETLDSSIVLNQEEGTTPRQLQSSISFPKEHCVLHIRGSHSKPNSFLNLNSISCFRSLVKLNLSFCNLVDGVLPYDVGCLSSLKKLYLNGNKFMKLPNSISQLSNLCTLNLKSCTRLQMLPPGICQLSNLNELLLDFCTRLQSLPQKLPFSLKYLSLESCPLWDELYGTLDALTSSGKLLIGDLSMMGTYIGYKDKPFLSLCLTPSANGQPYMKVSWGPTLGFEIPEWFNKKSTSYNGMNQFGMTLDVPAAISQALPLQMDEGYWWNYMFWGLALLIVYEIYKPDNYDRKSKRQKVVGHGSSTSSIFGGNSSTNPVFVCEVKDKVDGSRVSIGVRVPEVLPFGLHGVWVFIRDDSFVSKFEDGIMVEGHECKPKGREIEVSIKTISLNVEVKECGARVVPMPSIGPYIARPTYDLCEVLSAISPHGLLLLDPETIVGAPDVWLPELKIVEGEKKEDIILTD